MNKPNQLTIDQVKKIKEHNNGAPILTEKVVIDAKGTYHKDFKINENDVVLFNFVKQ
jgi:xylan 1,4-beta-xylosidase